MADVNVRINLITKEATAQLKAFRSQLSKAQSQLPKFGDAGERAGNRVSGSFKRIRDIAVGIIASRIFTTLISQVIQFGKEGVRAAFAFEQALAGVEKTTNITGASLEVLGDEFQRLSEEIPIAADELAGIAQIGGQLGVRGVRNLTKFTDTVAKLTATTDLSAESAGLALSRILNLTNEPIENIDRVGAAVVDLGNNFETLESELLTVTNEVARSTQGFGLNVQQSLALGTALKSLGARAEGSGTAVGRFFKVVDTALADNGPRLQEFSELTGLTAEQLRKDFAENALGVFQKFLEGAAKSGDSVSAVLRRVGLDQDRTFKSLAPLIESYPKLAATLRAASNAYKENTALNAEASRQFDTTNVSIDLLNNTIQNLITDSLLKLGPQIIKITRFWRNFINEVEGSNSIPEAERNVEQLRNRLDELRAASDRAEQSAKTAREEEAKRGRGILGNLSATNRRREAEERFGEVLDKIRITTNQLREAEERLKALRGEPETESGQTGGASGEDSRITKEQETLNKLAELRKVFRQNQAQVEADNATREDEIAEFRKTEEFERLANQLGEEEAIRIAADTKRKLNAAKTEDEITKIKADAAKQVAEGEKRAAQQQLQFDQTVGRQRAQIVGQTGQLIASLAKQGSKEQFLISKGFAFAENLLMTELAVSRLRASPIALLGPKALAAAEANERILGGLRAATILGSAIQGFQNGGVVPGASVQGDRVLARVNSGEMILNRQQQTELFNLANGGGPTTSSEVIVKSTVEIDGEAIGKAVSRQVADGLALGENV